MAEIEVEGKTVEDAIKEGLAKLGCSRDKVEVKILNEGTSGLFGLMGTKPARVLLTTKEETADTTAAKGSAVDYAAAQATVKDALTNILTLMHVEFTEIKTTAADERVKADISSSESSLLIGKGGQTLEAIEHVLNLIVNKDEHTRVKVDLDTESYHRRQDERLEIMAQKAADQVKRTGRLYRFDPMPAKDRRVIHLFLKNDPEVETFSEGEGQWRKVGVKPRAKK